MANNYAQGATLVPASCFAAGGAQAAEEILEQLTQILDSEDRPQEFDDFYSDCLDVQAQSDVTRTGYKDDFGDLLNLAHNAQNLQQSIVDDKIRDLEAELKELKQRVAERII